jgi:hypothetical protein
MRRLAYHAVLCVHRRRRDGSCCWRVSQLPVCRSVGLAPTRLIRLTSLSWRFASRQEPQERHRSGALVRATKFTEEALRGSHERRRVAPTPQPRVSPRRPWCTSQPACAQVVRACPNGGNPTRGSNPFSSAKLPMLGSQESIDGQAQICTLTSQHDHGRGGLVLRARQVDDAGAIAAGRGSIATPIRGDCVPCSSLTTALPAALPGSGCTRASAPRALSTWASTCRP